jgi:hypothetical protein
VRSYCHPATWPHSSLGNRLYVPFLTGVRHNGEGRSRGAAAPHFRDVLCFRIDLPVAQHLLECQSESDHRQTENLAIASATIRLLSCLVSCSG